ncbi:hypothetical protein EV127DRAFT_114084 [Xylaria flabelliformis]|nr:hypothetical protein EV127DRAFT_114084 [Xylaria flabelliformis]
MKGFYYMITTVVSLPPSSIAAILFGVRAPENLAHYCTSPSTRTSRDSRRIVQGAICRLTLSCRRCSGSASPIQIFRMNGRELKTGGGHRLQLFPVRRWPGALI